MLGIIGHGPTPVNHHKTSLGPTRPVTIQLGRGKPLPLKPFLLLSRRGRYINPSYSPIDSDGQRARYGVLDEQNQTLGTITINRSQRDESEFVFGFEATQPDLSLHSLGAETQGAMPGVESMLSNGSHSFANSGYLKLGAFPRAGDLVESLAHYGHADEEQRTGRANSWDFIGLGGDPKAPSLLAGAVGANQLKPYATAGFVQGGDQIKLRISSGVPQEKISLSPGSPVESSPWFIKGADSWDGLEQDYATKLANFNGTTIADRLLGHNLWNSTFGTSNQKDVLANAEAYANYRKTHPDLYDSHQPTKDIFWLDDGYHPHWGMYHFDSAKFPLGRDGLVKDISAKHDLDVGLWMPIGLAEVGSKIEKEHPELFMKQKIRRRFHKTLRLLDLRKPEAHDHIAATIKELRKDGIKALKLDFLHYIGSTDWGETPALTIYQNLLKTIRKAAGPDMLILACGAPMIPSLGKDETGRALVDAIRTGPDIAVYVPGILFGANVLDILWQIQTSMGRRVLNQALLTDLDGLTTRKLPDHAKGLAGLHKLIGRAMTLSDNFNESGVNVQENLTEALSDDIVQEFLKTDLSPIAPFRCGQDHLNHVPWWRRILGGQQHSFDLPELWQTSDGRRLAINFSQHEKTIEGHGLAPFGWAYLEPETAKEHAPSNVVWP